MNSLYAQQTSKKREEISQQLQSAQSEVETYSQNAYAYFNRGEIYLDLGQFDLAIADFNKVSELEPQNIDAHIWLFKIYAFYYQKNTQRALDELKKAEAINRNDIKLIELSSRSQLDLTISLLVKL